MVALSSIRPLRSRNFALVWSAALVSNVGSWMQTVALGFVITARTHNPLWTGLVAAAAFLPMGLLAPLGGVLADRLDRRRWLITTTVAEACFAAALAVLAATGHAQPAVLVGVAFLGGVAAAVGFPTSRRAILAGWARTRHYGWRFTIA
jgi:MFS family permease